MKPTHFAVRLSAFLTHYLPELRNLSTNTIKAYRDTFTLLLRFCRDARRLRPETLEIEQLDVPLIEAFLDHLEKDRNCVPRTRNQRLAALHAFFRYLQSEDPDLILQSQQILAIPSRRYARRTVEYLSKEELTAVLAKPDLRMRWGRRDAVLLSVLYDAGARVQELIDLSPRDLRLERPAHVRLTGKGRKTRIVPLMENTAKLLEAFVRENELGRADRQDLPLFSGRRGERLSRSGMRFIVQKYAASVGSSRSGSGRGVSPHTFRHTKGMHLRQAGVSLDVIRDFLGHSDIKTTEMYARADLEARRKALEQVGDGVPIQLPSWKKDPGLLEWLSSL